VLQSVAECCRVLQSVAVWCSVLQYVAAEHLQNNMTNIANMAYSQRRVVSISLVVNTSLFCTSLSIYICPISYIHMSLSIYNHPSPLPPPPPHLRLRGVVNMELSPFHLFWIPVSFVRLFSYIQVSFHKYGAVSPPSSSYSSSSARGYQRGVVTSSPFLSTSLCCTSLCMYIGLFPCI